MNQIPADIKADAQTMDTINTSPDKQNAKISSDKKVDKLMQQYMRTQTEIFKKYLTDEDFKRRYQEFVFETLWQAQQDSVA